ncbi:MarR family winged helix-turn-helix transcriptional regulator [Micromonospora sp. M12]
MDKTTMVVTLDQLERAGLAERRPVPTDRRARLVAVTPAGRRFSSGRGRWSGASRTTCSRRCPSRTGRCSCARSWGW